MRVMVINLDRRPDRLAFMRANLGAAGIPFERIAAIDGATLPPVTSSPVPIGEIACHKSHRLCWESLVASGDKLGLILEDDLLLSRDFAKFVADPPMPPDGDMLRLETFPSLVHVSRTSFPGPTGHQIHRLKSRLFGTAAYILTSRVARLLLEQDRSFELPVDHLLNLPERGTRPAIKLRIYQVVPAIAVQGMYHYEDESMPEEMKSDLRGSLRPFWLPPPDTSLIGRMKETLRPLYDRVRNVRTEVIRFDG